MSRLSFRPRPLDIHKKLPIVKSLKDFEEDETSTSTRNSQLLRIASVEPDNEVHHIPTKKLAPEIPTPQFVIVDTYERDYARTFAQPTSYLRARGARAELGEFVEYDLDNEDEDWLQEFNKDRKNLSPERFENFIFKLEVLDHKARERSGVIIPTLGSPIPVLLQLDSAVEALQAQSQSTRNAVFQSVYNYWKEKMQRRENNVQSFEKLRLVRRNLDHAKTILEALIKNETELLEDSLALPGFAPLSSKFASSEEEFVDSDDLANSRPRTQPAAVHNPLTDNILTAPAGSLKQEFRRRHTPYGWLNKMDPLEPVLLFTKPLVPEKLAAAGIVPPVDSSSKNCSSAPPFRFHGRIGRGGRIVFDRWNPFLQTSIELGNSFYFRQDLALQHIIDIVTCIVLLLWLMIIWK
ncbi:hypothetical protein GH714_014773 [Hevea brasiliensis]|uniref:Enhancer of polycomb-like protein n=1 Tax=Hevea brasiliensis TaxID=3981 RepID=A0A6A6KDY5_HEVBR|nr:hypothetical protein GH714_014773 [Hevea brasiliensis]